MCKPLVVIGYFICIVRNERVHRAEIRAVKRRYDISLVQTEQAKFQLKWQKFSHFLNTFRLAIDSTPDNIFQ